MTIFVQIASYRDPELVPTLRSAFAEAAYPDDLRFCVAWQHHDTESLQEFSSHPQVKILDIPYEESRGACWARNQTQKEYRGEDFTLMLDSHHRFATGWDRFCVATIQRLQEQGHQKPLLTTYAPPYDPSKDPEGRGKRPTEMLFDGYTVSGVIGFRPAYLSHKLQQPVPARFLSAHFVFTLGEFCEEVPHDPDFYFLGEEISLAVRAFTHGYDLFHPHEIVVWHEYTRKNRRLHWDDHKKWHVTDQLSLARNRALLGVDGERSEEDFGRFGLGIVRTLNDYELYAGIRFGTRAVHEDTRAGRAPLVGGGPSGEEGFFRDVKHTIEVNLDIDRTDYDFLRVIYTDLNGEELLRRDVKGNELHRAIVAVRSKSKAEVAIESVFPVPAQSKPGQNKWILWPHCRRSGWGSRLEGGV